MDMDLVEFAGWPDCIRLTDGAIELIVTTAVGPRIIAARRVDGDNLLWVDPDAAGLTGGDEWRSYGGGPPWVWPPTPRRAPPPPKMPPGPTGGGAAPRGGWPGDAAPGTKTNQKSRGA